METDQFVHKALNQDADPALQPKDTYRDGLNGYLVSAGNDSYIFTSADGNTLSFSLDPTLVGHQGIGWGEGLDRLYILSTNDSSEEGGPGAISRIDLNQETGLGVTPTAEIVYEDSNLNFTTKHIMGKEVILIKESDVIERIYFTDKFNNFRVLNVADPDAGSLDVNLLDIVPNKVTSTVELETVDKFHTHDVTGELVSGVNRYLYRLRSSEAAVVTTWSQLSVPIFINPEDVGQNIYTSPDLYQSFQGGSFEEVTTKAASLVIDNIDQIYDEIEVAFFFYDGVDLNPNGIIFAREDITGTQMFFQHRGGENFGTVTPADVLVTEARIDTVGTIASNENRMIIGDISEVEQVDLTDVAAEINISTWTYRMYTPIKLGVNPTQPASGHPTFETPGQKAFFGSIAALEGSTGVESGDIVGHTATTNPRDMWYRVVTPSSSIRYPAGIGPIISSGEYFQGQAGFKTFDIISGVPKVVSHIRIQKFGALADTDEDKFKSIGRNSDWYDHKGVFNSGYVRGHWRGETYRWAIHALDLKGRPTFSFHIADHKMPEIFEDTTRPGLINSASLHEPGDVGSFIKHLGVAMDNIDLTPLVAQLGLTDEKDLVKHISGFRIVRAVRDEGIRAQGLLWPTHRVSETGGIPTGNSDLELGTTFPMQTNRIWENSVEGQDAVRQEFVYLFHSPDHLFNFKNRFPDTLSPEKINGFDMRIIDYLDPGPAPNAAPGFRTSDPSNFTQLFFRSAGVTGGAPVIGTRNRIKSMLNVKAGDVNIVGYDVEHSLRLFSNRSLGGASNSAPGAFGNYGAGIESSIVLLSNGETQAQGFGDTRTGIDIDIPLVNMVKANNNPYGGQSKGSLAKTNYVTVGHFQPINLDVYALNGNSWKFDNVEIWGGDCFINNFDIGRMAPIGELSGSPNPGIGISGTFVCESNINTGLRQGRHAAKDRFLDDQGSPTEGSIHPNGISFSEPIQLEDFIYNEAYSHSNSNVLYPALPLDLIPKKQFFNRVRHSPVKIPNEPIDNFRRFLLDDRLEVDIKDGRITNLRIRGERLFYWQEKAIGYLPINERALVAGAFGEPVQLGVGGVLVQYDERTDFYGNQHQHGLIETPEGFVWPDVNNRALVNLKDGGGIIEITTAKGLMTFLDRILKAVPGDNPVDGTGIVGIYCARTKNTYITFKSFKNNNVVVDGGLSLGPTVSVVDGIFFTTGALTLSDGDLVTLTFFDRAINEVVTLQTNALNPTNNFFSVLRAETFEGRQMQQNDVITITVLISQTDNGITLSFNHLRNAFIDFHSFVPSMYMRFKDYMLAMPHKAPVLPNIVTINVGEVYTSTDGNNYVCFSAFQSGFVQPENDTIHFRKVSELRQAYVFDEGDIAKYFGVVSDTIIEMVVNPDVSLEKVFDNIRSNNGVNAWTEIQYSNSIQFATDLDIVNNQEYELRNRVWYGSIAEDDTGRMTDIYLIIRFIKDNRFNGDPTRSSNKKIKMLSLKTDYREVK